GRSHRPRPAPQGCGWRRPGPQSPRPRRPRTLPLMGRPSWAKWERCQFARPLSAIGYGQGCAAAGIVSRNRRRPLAMKKLDIFPHIFPKPYFDKMVEIVPSKDAIRRWTNIPVLYDLEKRLHMMDEFEQYQQVLTLSMPAIEFVAQPDQSP